MKLSEGVEWALHCATVLALLPQGAVLPGRALAELHGVSESYLLKHLKRLTQAGLFLASPGPKGGYRLARPPADISFLHIVQAIEGAAPAFRCAEIRQRGPAAAASREYGAPCVIHAAMRQAEQAWRAQLAKVSLSDMTERLGRSVHPSSRDKGLAWLGENART